MTKEKGFDMSLDMETFKKILPAVTVFVLCTGFVFSGFNWMLNAQTKQINAQIQSVNEKLDNHITDTNKKIERLSDRFDKLSDRFDKLSDRFDKLYDYIMQEKREKK